MRTIFGTTSSDCSRRWRWLGSCRPPRNSESNRYDRGLQTGWRRKWSIWDVCGVPCRIFSVLSAILYLGNVTYSQKSSGREEGLDVGPPEVLSTLSDLLKVNALPKLATRDVIFTYLCRFMCFLTWRLTQISIEMHLKYAYLLLGYIPKFVMMKSAKIKA